MEHEVSELLADKYSAEKAAELSKLLTSGTWTHDLPLHYIRSSARLRPPVRNDMPEKRAAPDGTIPTAHPPTAVRRVFAGSLPSASRWLASWAIERIVALAVKAAIEWPRTLNTSGKADFLARMRGDSRFHVSESAGRKFILSSQPERWDIELLTGIVLSLRKTLPSRRNGSTTGKGRSPSDATSPPNRRRSNSSPAAPYRPGTSRPAKTSAPLKHNARNDKPMTRLIRPSRSRLRNSR